MYRLENDVKNSVIDAPAKTMLMIMVRGLCSNLVFPYAQFSCSGLKGNLMYRPISEALYRLERLGLKVKYIYNNYSASCIHHAKHLYHALIIATN